MSLFSKFRKSPPAPEASAPLPAASKQDKKAERERAAAAEEITLQAALKAKDFQTITRLVVQGSSTQVRQAAANAIDDLETLRQLIRDIRGKDDNVYKILTVKRDVHLERIRAGEQLQAAIDSVSEAAERLSRREYDVLFPGKLKDLESSWDAISAQVDAAVRDKIQPWVDKARETQAAHQRELAEKAAREQAEAAAAAEAKRLREEQLQAEAAARAAEEAERAQAAEAQKREADEKHHAGQQAIRQIGGLIRKAQEALKDGNTSVAAGLRRSLEEKLAGAPPLPAGLAAGLQQIDQKLSEMKDWKVFTVAPKRTELIEAMEMLIGMGIDPPVLAERIKNLQDEWRTLAKGAAEDHQPEWQRFHAVAQLAYAPCKEYFAAQALVRAENLKHRQELLDKLVAVEAAQNWEQPDWPAINNAVRNARRDWYRWSPVERQAGKPLQERFDAVLENLETRLKGEHTRISAKREALIEQAKKLIAGDDTRKAMDEVKNLQRKWQATEPLPRHLDQRLWEEFRKHCDAVFKKRDQEVAAHAASLEGNKSQAATLCEQLEKIAALEGAELQAQAATIAELRNGFEALELPKADARDLRNRFKRAMDRYEASLGRERARQAGQAWDHLFEAANHVRAYRLAAARNAEPQALDALKSAAESHMASIQRWPKGGLEALKKALGAERAADLSANEAALRLLCVRAEIIADVATPPEDQEVRRKYQLERLVRNMGQGGRGDDTTLDTLALEWVKAGPVDDALYDALLERFRRCRR